MKKYFLIVMVSLLLSACSLSPVKPLEINTYTLNAVSQKQFSKYPNISTILVVRPIAAPTINNNQMFYQLKPHELTAFTRNRWLTPPADMLLPLIVQSLENSNYYHAVIASPFTGITNYRLVTRLNSLYQDFLQKPSAVVMQLQATLINTRTQKIIATQTFNARVPAPQNNPYSGVLAANQATQQILIGLTTFTIANS